MPLSSVELREASLTRPVRCFRRLATHQLKDALEKAGYSEERARTLAQKSGGHLGSLLRCLQNLSLMPEWAEGSAAAELAIAAVLGSGPRSQMQTALS